MGDARASDSKYLTFRLAAEEFGVAILKVREIIGLMDITAVPRAPQHVRGVINLRGKIIPVIDLRRKLGLPEAAASRENCVVTSMIENDGQGILVGLLVDAVSEVLTVDPADIDPVPALNDVKLPFVTGLAKGQGKVRILLDIDKVVGEETLESVLSLHEENAAALSA
jgi:purine-binding chemotaxis protein CheW